VKIRILGHELEVPHIMTGLTKDPFACDPVVPRIQFNTIEALGLEVCQEHNYFTGSGAPSTRCALCWKNYREILARAYRYRMRQP
jgi:hypothetical protein